MLLRLLAIAAIATASVALFLTGDPVLFAVAVILTGFLGVDYLAYLLEDYIAETEPPLPALDDDEDDWRDWR